MRSPWHSVSSGQTGRWGALALCGLSVCVVRGQPLQFTNVSVGRDGSFQAQLCAEIGQSYTLEVSTNLLEWHPKTCFTDVTTNRVTLVGPPPVNFPERLFYRAKRGATVLRRLSFDHFALGGWVPLCTGFPTSFSRTAEFVVENDTDYPAATNVVFTGPAGSALTNAPARASRSEVGANSATYRCPYPAAVTQVPSGQWTVTYKGTNHEFTFGDPDTVARLVVPDVSVTYLSWSQMRLNWTYRDTITGAELGGPPALMTQIQATYERHTTPILPPATTSWILPASFAREPVALMVYKDVCDNTYEVVFTTSCP